MENWSEGKEYSAIHVSPVLGERGEATGRPARGSSEKGETGLFKDSILYSFGRSIGSLGSRCFLGERDKPPFSSDSKLSVLYLFVKEIETKSVSSVCVPVFSSSCSQSHRRCFRFSWIRSSISLIDRPGLGVVEVCS